MENCNCQNCNCQNIEPTPYEIANAISSFAESAIKLKEAGILSEDTINLSNDVAQTVLNKLKEMILKANWDFNNDKTNPPMPMNPPMDMSPEMPMSPPMDVVFANETKED